MATTTTRADLRASLDELISLACDAEVAQEKLESRAREIRADCTAWDGFPYYWAAVDAEIRGALDDARGEHGCSRVTFLQIAQGIQDAIDILDIATAREESERPDGEVS
jgi:hypothetical protein